MLPVDSIASTIEGGSTESIDNIAESVSALMCTRAGVRSMAGSNKIASMYVSVRHSF
jgi:hypothetical protein